MGFLHLFTMDNRNHYEHLWTNLVCDLCHLKLSILFWTRIEDDSQVTPALGRGLNRATDWGSASIGVILALLFWHMDSIASYRKKLGGRRIAGCYDQEWLTYPEHPGHSILVIWLGNCWRLHKQESAVLGHLRTIVLKWFKYFYMYL